MSEYIYASEGELLANIDGGISIPRERVIRCLDCKYFRIGINYDVCAFTDKYTRHDGFCSWAVRKEVDELGLSERTCRMVVSGTPCNGNTDVACTKCGAYNIGEFYDGNGHRSTPRFCPSCGAKVVDK